MADEQKKMLDVYLQEYGNLKNERAQCIRFRDNLLYVTLALFGTVLASSWVIQRTPIGSWRFRGQV